MAGTFGDGLDGRTKVGASKAGGAVARGTRSIFVEPGWSANSPATIRAAAIKGAASRRPAFRLISSAWTRSQRTTKSRCPDILPPKSARQAHTGRSPLFACPFAHSTIIRAETRRNWGFYLAVYWFRALACPAGAAGSQPGGDAFDPGNAQFLATFRNILTSSEKLPACVFFITLARWTSTVRGLIPIS